MECEVNRSKGNNYMTNCHFVYRVVPLVLHRFFIPKSYRNIYMICHIMSYLDTDSGTTYLCFTSSDIFK